MIKVLIVEDEIISKEMLFRILSSDPEIEVIGQVDNGKKAVEFVKHRKPDVITMDINMPIMNGFEATRMIMSTTPIPIVIVSASWEPKEVETSFLAIEAGALAILEKPRGIGHPLYEKTSKEVIETVKTMSQVKTITRRPKYKKATLLSAKSESEKPQVIKPREIKIVAIGASTGGPLILQTILSELPKDFPVPIVIVQHIAEGFTEGFADWLSNSSPLNIHVANDGESILPGHVYIGRDGFQMEINKEGKIVLIKDTKSIICPSVSNLFFSVANAFGENAIGILLTGMGKDGADGLKLMQDKGAITIAQNEESSVIFGMPGIAIETGAAIYEYSPEEIIEALKLFVMEKMET